MANMDWSSLVEIDDSWYANQLVEHFKEINEKITVVVNTVKVSGTTMLPDSLVSVLHDMLPEYVFGKKKIEELGIKKAALTANRFFGERHTNSEGKFGELLLFALVESVLKCKMVAHKIRSLTNMSDQVKGGDGLFLGNYTLPDMTVESAFLLGESKIVSSLAIGLHEAFSSLDRFHNQLRSPEFRSTELLVAKENVLLSNDVDLDELYKRLNVETEEYKDQIHVHPVLIMFNTKSIGRMEQKALSRSDLEAKISTYITKAKGNIATGIAKQIKKYQDVSKVYLHFFIVPFNDVNKFRNAMYYAIHGVNYPEKEADE
ncbi:MAG: hypothetical protein BGO69_14705 [Bacteroidetes bacterium 46-16]|nr:MAG: hypothetical protein BGO69_14705 [Bacteroidetes bacterium 46-16]